MTEMDQQVETRFMNTFKQFRRPLVETFTQIFDGGEAKLILTEPSQPLTTGVDIVMAQPPGKRNQRLSLLSGGTGPNGDRPFICDPKGPAGAVCHLEQTGSGP